MIQDIAPNVYRNEFVPTEPKGSDTVFSFNGRNILLAEENGEIVFPKVSEFKEETKEGALCFLFKIDGKRFFLWHGGMYPEFGRYTYQNLNILRKPGQQELRFAGMTAYHLYVWYRDNTFCGRCGRKLGFAKTERAMVCEHCGNTIYPKICPAVIVCVTDGDRCVVTRYAGRPYKGHALIAGFCEIGETAEETVRREVMEEVGLKVKNIRYYASQPWGFEMDLLLGYYCDVDGDTTIHRDPGELAVAEWVDRSELETIDYTLSLTSDMMDRFRLGEEIQ